MGDSATENGMKILEALSQSGEGTLSFGQLTEKTGLTRDELNEAGAELVESGYVSAWTLQ